LFEEISASMKLIQTRNQTIKAGHNVWDSDVDGCPIGDSPGIAQTDNSSHDDSVIIRWSDCSNSAVDSKEILPLALDNQGVLRATYESGLWVSVDKIKFDILLQESPLFQKNPRKIAKF